VSNFKSPKDCREPKYQESALFYWKIISDKKKKIYSINKEATAKENFFQIPESAKENLYRRMWGMPLVEGEEAVLPLIDLLDDENPVVRLRLAEILCGSANNARTQLLIQMLKDNDGRVRKQAVISLGTIGTERAIDSLIPMLEDVNEAIREEADKWLNHLGWQPEPDIKTLVANSDVEGLIEATAFEKDVKIRGAAAEALGELRDPRAIEPLISLLRVDWGYKSLSEKASDALAKIGSPAVDTLITTLKNAKRSSDPYSDEDATLRGGTASALGKIGDPKAIDELIGNLWDIIPFVRWNAADALGAIGDPAVPRLIGIIDQFGINAPRATARALKIVAGQDFQYNAAAWKRWWKEYRQSKDI